MKDLQDLVERSWTESSQRYDVIIENELQSFKKEVWQELILSQAPKKSEPLKILDIGTGPGFFPVILSSEMISVTAIDCTENMITLARKNVEKANKKADFRVMDSHLLDFPDECFDMVISRNVAWTLSEPEKAYGEWGRVVCKGGRVLIFDANWQRYFHDEAAKKFFEEHDKNYFARYGEHIEGFMQQSSDPGMMKELRRSMPLGHQQRPQWDLDILLKLGFQQFNIDMRIGEKVWTPEEQFKYLYAPMFMISAER